LFDRLYGTVALARRRWFERHPFRVRWLDRPVVSVGNLSVGGTGKTPVAAAIARWLVERGERPAILSRGYRREHAADGVTVVSDGSRILAALESAGDEPLMLARQVPGAVVCVAADRYLAGVLAERRLGATVHVLDDGFQHVGLARDLDILVSGRGEIENGRVLPAGRLREPVAAAARAHVVIVLGADAAAAAGEAWALGIGESCGARRVLGEPIVSAAGDGQLAADRSWPVVAVAGIARPSRFFEALEGAGWTIGRQLPFADHHAFTPADVASIAAAVAVSVSRASLVVTTEKDAVRFEALGALPFALARVPMSVEFDRWETIEAALEAALERGRVRRTRREVWPPQWGAAGGPR
jgi:tetraacyldisaccharide 4'-kinase